LPRPLTERGAVLACPKSFVKLPEAASSLAARPHGRWAPLLESSPCSEHDDPEVPPMPDDPRLLTVVLESTDDLDREGVTYRRLLAARLKFEDQYEIQVCRQPLSTTAIQEILSTIASKYVI